MAVGHRAGVRKRILNEVGYQVLRAPKPIKGMVTIKIHLLRASTKPWDEGNIGSGGAGKWVIDALVKLGVLKNDGPSDVKYETPTQEYLKPWKTRAVSFKRTSSLIVTLEQP